MINTDYEEIFAHFREPRPVFCSIVLNFLVSPGLAFIAGTLFLSSQPFLFAGLMLISLIPTSSMSVAWTSFSNANLATALYLIPLNILFAAFIGIPVIFPLIAERFIEINTLMIVKNIFTVFFIPLILGGIARKLIIGFKGEKYFASRVKPGTGTVSAAGILLLIFMVMAQERNAMLMENFGALMLAVIPIFLYYLFMYGASVFWMNQLVKRGAVDGKNFISRTAGAAG